MNAVILFGSPRKEDNTIQLTGNIEATGCEQERAVKDEYKEKTKTLAESLA
jgi:hypothetical protein